MAMRMSGLMSGLDTETIIQQLVEARSTKVNTAKKAQTKLSWKQDAWKELNTKLKNLQFKFVSDMRFYNSYSKKTTKVSNESAVSVLTGKDAVNGVQTIQVDKLAKSGYLTGAELKSADGRTKGNYSALTKLSELGVAGSASFSIKTEDSSVDINVNENSTISDVLNQLKSAGVNANFDAKSQRFFISAKESGLRSDFSITASDAAGADALSKLGLQVNLSQDKATLAEYQEYAAYFDASDRDRTLDNMRTLIDSAVAARTNSYLDKYKSLRAGLKTAQDKKQEIEDKYQADPLLDAKTYADQIDAKKTEMEELKQKLKDDATLTDADKTIIAEKVAGLAEEINGLSEKRTDAETLETQQKNIDSLTEQIGDVEEYIVVTEDTVDGVTTYSAQAANKLIEEEEDKFYAKASYASQVMANYDPDDTTSTGATKVSGQDAVIYLNGAEFTNNTNVFEINGLTFTALNETKGETVTVTTQDDTDGIYDMIRNFLKEYNSVINEMDKLYNADSARGYEPLTSEEKAALAESEVEEYEKKIKDALLRRDENLNDVSSALKGIMSSGVTVNGKTMYLSDFGINTLSYFSAADNERNAYHIDGDPDDSSTSGNADVLKSMISNDPDTVISFFTGLSKNLYSKMTDLSKSVDGYRSYGSFFDDKKMKSDYDDYTSKIADLEQKLNDYEDKWYAKFAKMETAMAKMQNNANAIAGLLGG